MIERGEVPTMARASYEVTAHTVRFLGGDRQEQEQAEAVQEELPF